VVFRLSDQSLSLRDEPFAAGFDIGNAYISFGGVTPLYNRGCGIY